MTDNPFSSSPGPERRELMRQQYKNTSPNDYTPEEWAAIEERAQAARDVFASMDSDTQA